jgi:glycosyltransferase involved in cell wall biosynthesis
LEQLPRIFLSSTYWSFGLRNGPFFIPGRSHYSYEIVRRKFEAALRLLGVEVHDVARPPIYAAPVSRRFLTEDCCHLIFKPAELIRIVKGVRNIGCVAWEFDKLIVPKTLTRFRPARDMRRMLSLPEEIWAPCEFTRRVFRDHGIRNVFRIPAPISVPSSEPLEFGEIPPELDRIAWVNLRLGSGRDRDIDCRSPRPPSRLSNIIRNVYQGRRPDIFLTILNPHDRRKNLTALIGGFLEFHAEYPNSLLLLKLVVDNEADGLDTVRAGVLPRVISGYAPIDSNAVWLTTAYLPNRTLNELYRVCSAYLCTSRAEGQNLPLQEAMSFGLVPISTCHTAMLDYISEHNAVIIRSTKRPTGRSGVRAWRAAGATWHVCTSADVAEALRAFAALGQEDRRELGSRARAVIAKDFSIQTVARLIRARLLQRRT